MLFPPFCRKNFKWSSSISRPKLFFIFIVLPLNKNCTKHFRCVYSIFGTSQVAQWVKNPLQRRRYGFDPWVKMIPWRRAQQPTPVFLPGESHGQRSLAGCSPWGHKDLYIIEVTEHVFTCIPPLWTRLFFCLPLH